MSVAQKLASFVGGDPLATAQAKSARLDRKEADSKAALEAHAGRKAAARVALAQTVSDDGDSKAAARELANLDRESDALTLEAEAATEAAEIARRAVSDLRERRSREEAEAAVASATATATKARPVLVEKLREVRELVGSTWAEERRAAGLAQNAKLETDWNFGLDLAAVCEELDAEILATNPERGTTQPLPLSLLVLRS